MKPPRHASPAAIALPLLAAILACGFLNSCATAKNVGGSVVDLAKKGGKAFGRAWRNETEGESSFYSGESDAPMNYRQRVLRERAALKTYMKDPSADPSKTGMAFSMANKDFQEAAGSTFNKEYSTKSATTGSYTSKQWQGSSKTWGGQDQAARTKNWQGADKRDRSDPASEGNSLGTRSYNTGEYRTDAASESRTGTYSSRQEPVYERKYSAPRTVEEDTIRNIYDVPHDINDIKKSLGR